MTGDPTQTPGAVVADRYKVVGMLGRGGGGVVCEVVDLSTGRPAALKMLVGDDPTLAARLEREGKALAMLAHPNIVALIDTGTTGEGAPFVVTELIRGSSVRDLIDTDLVEPRRALAIVRQLLEALNHVHGAGLIHRDIKPDNLMLVAGGQPGRDDECVKLLDFGVAKVLDHTSVVLGEDKLTRAGLKVFGSPPYIAPETAIGEPIDYRTDLYSVGIVLFELLTGRVPFDHEDRVTLLRMHVTDPAPPLHIAAPERTFTPELEHVVARALAKLPDQRFTSAIDMHAAVQAAARSLDAPADDGARAAASAPAVVRSAPPASAPPVATPPSIQAPAAAMPFAAELATLVPPRGAMPAPAPFGSYGSPGELAARPRGHLGRAVAIFTAGVVLTLIAVIVIRNATTAAVDEKAPAVTADAAQRARSFVTQGDTDLAQRRYDRAIVAYERAIATDRTLAKDAKVQAAVAQIASRADAVAAVIALELLATRFDPPDTKTIAEHAATAKLPPVRRRAFAIAERDGFAQAIDRFASWTLDLRQPATCDERRETIAKLRELGDRRAIEALQRARTQFACVAKDAADAVAHLQKQP